MSFDQTLRWPAAELDRDKLAAVVKQVAKQSGDGVVATRRPDELDPDPDEYVRAGFEDAEADDDGDEITWSFGFPSGSKRPGERYRWARIRFTHDEDGCVGNFDNTDYDPLIEDAWFSLIGDLVEALGGQLEEL